ncbi:inter-alpha-trypsin inhibitor heavy chain H2-like, partial [Convolutriloba macropyga]|uniref:inter-alpha-trypsin inhibitor heavy chain H2-like n=1 Tax=Convolutriloba macropyga TaxID=536237 RepID=UPI003F5211FB
YKHIKRNKLHLQMVATPDQLKFLKENNIRGRIQLKYRVIPLTGSFGKFYIKEDFFLYKMSPSTLATIPKNVVFVVDRSGSTAGIKLEAIKSSFETLIRNLTSNDKFTVISFSSSVDVFMNADYRNSKNRIKNNPFVNLKPDNCLSEATEYNKLDALSFIHNLDAIGDTDINQALSSAIECLPQPYDVINLVYFITDGKANIGTTDTHKIMSHIKSMQRKKKTKARIFTIGLGSDVDNAFLQQLSRHFDGSATAVPAESQTQMAQDIKDFFLAFSQPLLRNLVVSMPELQMFDISTTSFVTFYRGSEITVVGQLTNETKHE